MAHPDFPEDVRQFILAYINSLESLEVLLVLSGDPAREWTPAEMAQRVYSQPASAEDRLNELMRLGLVENTGRPQATFRYKPRDPELDDLVKKLGQVYQERRVTVIELIFSKPLDKIRTFADAFKLRKD